MTGARGRCACTLLALAALLLVAGCDKKEPAPTYDRAQAWKQLGVAPSEEAFDKGVADLGKAKIDPPASIPYPPRTEFPPDLPFDPSKWIVNRPGPDVNDPRAKKGGTLRLAFAEWLPTVRTEGANSRSSALSDIHGMIYEPLLVYDSTIEDYVPRLATHWQIDEDKQTFRFRIDPRARWADPERTPVTADDVLATFEHLQNPDRKDPGTSQIYQELIESVRVLDRLTVEVKTEKREWRSFLMVATYSIYPARYIRMDGETYLSDWNWKVPPGSGPYELRPEDVKKPASIAIRRRSDWWSAGDERFAGMFNFDEIRWDVVRGDELLYQKFLAGEVDVFLNTMAQKWVDEVDKARPVAMGWVQKRKIYTLNPSGFGGYVFNMREAPFDSRDTRLAFAHLVNREKMFAKFFFYQYDYIDSYFPGQSWARPGAQPVRYDPAEARRLLAQAGWTERDTEGFLSREDGTRFPTLEIQYASQGFQRIHAAVKEDLWREAGIRMDLTLLDGPSITRRVWEFKYKVAFFNWTGSLFPDHEYFFHSKYADQQRSGNLAGLKDPKLDGLLDAYKLEFDKKKRNQMLQEIDAILFDAHPYALAWFGPYFRILYWDKFGHPAEYTQRHGDYPDDLMAFWWYDPERAQRTQEKKASGASNYPERTMSQYDDVDQRYWLTNTLPKPR
ncbi:MAG: ABC transporter substrate-binding protein [Planctomycetota bacterium]